MYTVIFYEASGKRSGEETYTTRHAALTRARCYVTRDGLNTYRRRSHGTQVTYYHSYGEREALVREQPEEA